MNKSKSVLIIEDETVLRDAYKLILTHAGYNVMTAENGQVGLEILSKNLPDLILLDLLMPVMGGKEFLSKADIKKKHPSVKVIVYSNLSDQNTINDIVRLGVDKHVLKSSMSPNDLVEQVRAFVSLEN